MESLAKLKINDLEIRENVNLERYTTIKLGGIGTLAICKSIESTQEIIKYCRQKKIDYHLVGWGANQVLGHHKNYLYLKLDFDIDKNYLKSVREVYDLPASFSLNSLTSHAIKNNLSGWEVFTGIPASLGGAIYMNAGTALGEIGNLIKEVTILEENGEIYNYTPSKDSFSYRKNHFVKKGEIILSAKISHNGIKEGTSEKIKNYLEYRKKTQPLTTKNCGSVFKNNGDFKAGIVIDKCGLKGFGSESIQVSQKHGNFIENVENGNVEDFCDVISRLTDEIERYSGLKFELEVKIY